LTALPDGPDPGSRDTIQVESTGALLREGVERLLAAGSETPRLDAELLLGHAVGVGRTAVLAHPEAPVGADAARRFRADIDRRATSEPVAYLRGLKEFYGLAFQADSRALIPRPETERLVDLARDEVMRRLGSVGRLSKPSPMRVVDVGTGGGAIVIALAVSLRELAALEAVELVAVDISAEALELARENAVAHAVAARIAFVAADILPAETGKFDLVLANLPYVRHDAMAGLRRAASFEPALALDGGADGLDVIERLLDRLPRALVADGLALLEIGADQGDAIVARAEARLPGWRCTVELDLAGFPRVARIERVPSA
jgi:release factor glutamine methyltransferase